MKAEWRYAQTTSGVLFVLTLGESLMLLWCVSSWVIPLKVNISYIFGHFEDNFQYSSPVLTDVVAFTTANFGTGTGPVYLDSVTCSGSENNLIDCPRNSYSSCYYYSGGAGVRCQGLVH